MYSQFCHGRTALYLRVPKKSLRLQLNQNCVFYAPARPSGSRSCAAVLVSVTEVGTNEDHIS